jgi:hypothetical protein
VKIVDKFACKQEQNFELRHKVFEELHTSHELVLRHHSVGVNDKLERLRLHVSNPADDVWSAKSIKEEQARTF